MASTISQRPAGGGARPPRIFHQPSYVTSAGKEAIDLARLAGLELDPWQQDFLIASLGEDADGRWAAMECALVVPRQNGKNAVLLARELAGLFILEEQDMRHSAQQQETSVEQYHKLVALIETTPELSRRVERMPAGKGSEAIILHRDKRTGRKPRLLFRSRTGPSGLGFSMDFLAFDEALILPEMLHGHLFPILSARPNPQIWYLSSAVDELRHKDGVVLARIRERALAGDDESLVYAEYSANVDSLDHLTRQMAESWGLVEEANPALDIRISRQYVERERQKLDLQSYGNMRLNIGRWPDTSEEPGRLIKQDIWNALADPGSKIAKGHAFAFDVDPHQAWATLSVAGEREDGLYHIAVVEQREGIGWIVGSCKQWLERFPGSRLIVDPRVDLGNLLNELDAAGIQPITTETKDYKDACGGFLQAVTEKRLRYMPPQPELDSAVAGATTKPLGDDGWKWSRKSGALITPLVSCTLALWGARTQGTPTVWSLGEVADRMRREREGQPEPAAEPATPAAPGRRFIPLDQAPVSRGLFRP
jgi:hypothetical protein